MDESQTNVALYLRLEVDEVVHDRVDYEQTCEHVGDGQVGDDVAAGVVVERVVSRHRVKDDGVEEEDEDADDEEHDVHHEVAQRDALPVKTPKKN